MKKLCLVVCLILSLSILTSCAKKNPNPTPTPTPPITITPTSPITITPTPTPTITTTPPPSGTSSSISSYFSYKPNIKYVFEGKGNEYAAYTVFVDYIVGTKVQLRIDNGGTETVKVMENKNGKLSVILSKSEVYYRENLTNSSIGSPEIILKEPLVKGTTWTLPDKSKRFISNVDVKIKTKLGTYKTIEVTTKNKSGKILDYYAPNVGLVKSAFLLNGKEEVSSTLAKMGANIPLVQTVQFYYPNTNLDKVYYIGKKLSFKTNDITKIVFEKAFKALPAGKNLARVLTPNAKIKSLYLNKDNAVYVDFSKEFLTEMNAGSGYESLILKSITNTLGVYYGVNKVHITVEGKPYASGHIELKKGEFFKVDLKNTFQLK